MTAVSPEDGRGRWELGDVGKTWGWLGEEMCRVFACMFDKLSM